MRLSYTLIREWLYCPFRMKIEKFERVSMPEAPHSVRAKILGRLVHAGQAEYLKWDAARQDKLLGKPGYPKRIETCVRQAIKSEMDRQVFWLGCTPGSTDHKAILKRIEGMVARWATFFKPHAHYRSMLVGGAALEAGCRAGGMIETRFHVPMEHISRVNKFGIFTDVVAAPDWVALGIGTDHPHLIDWKWRTELTPDSVEPERFNVQPAFYQRILRAVGINVYSTMTVEGIREEPTVPKVTKSGSLNRSPIRISWSEYEKHVLAAGLDPDDYQDMREKCIPAFREHRTFRSAVEVDGIWADVIFPVANLIDKTVRNNLPFPRVMDPDKCGRCHLREACTAGITKRAHHPAFNQATLVKGIS